MRLRREGCLWPFSLSVQPEEAGALDRSLTVGKKRVESFGQRTIFIGVSFESRLFFVVCFAGTPWFLCGDAAVVTVDSGINRRRNEMGNRAESAVEFLPFAAFVEKAA